VWLHPVSLPNPQPWHSLTRGRQQRERCCEDSGGCYFDTAMRNVYVLSSAIKVENKRKCSAHRLKSETFKAAVCTSGDDSPFMKIHDGLKEACYQRIEVLRQQLKKDIGAILRTIAEDLKRTQQFHVEQPELENQAQTAMHGALYAAKDSLSILQSKLAGIGVKLEE
jgi:hypothetical protein